MVNCTDSSLFAGNRIRLPIGTVALKHSRSNQNDETYLLNFTNCSSYAYYCTVIFTDALFALIEHIASQNSSSEVIK